MSSGPNPLLVQSRFLVHFLRTSSLMTSLHSEICNHFMTGDQGATHKLKPRLFIKSYIHFDVFYLPLESPLEFILLLSNIPLWHSTLFHSGEYLYILLCSFVPSIILSLTIHPVVNELYLMSYVTPAFKQ